MSRVNVHVVLALLESLLVVAQGLDSLLAHLVDLGEQAEQPLRQGTVTHQVVVLNQGGRTLQFQVRVLVVLRGQGVLHQVQSQLCPLPDFPWEVHRVNEDGLLNVFDASFRLPNQSFQVASDSVHVAESLLVHDCVHFVGLPRAQALDGKAADVAGRLDLPLALELLDQELDGGGTLREELLD